jgi:antitoxin component YwqK of YwqJK toxin-antitoxin module
MYGTDYESEIPTECLQIIREFIDGIYFTEKLPNGELSTGYKTSDGLLHGIHRIYYTSGRLKLIFWYESGVLRRQMKITHDGKRVYDFQYMARSALRANGTTLCVDAIEDRTTESGVDASRRTVSDRVDASRRTAKFLKHGKQKKWYRNGQLAENLNYEYGIQCGKQQCWSINGKLSEF